MGRPKKPSAQKKLEGTWRHDRNPVNEPEYKVAIGKKAPMHLNKYAKQFWKEYYPILCDSGVLTIADFPQFIAMCQSWGDYMEADYSIHHDQEGKKRSIAEYRNIRKNQKKYMPEIAERKEALERFNRLASQFGMSPSTRNKIDLGKKENDVDPMEAMLYGVEKAK